MATLKNIGDRMKQYERDCMGSSLMPFLPTIVRLDGRAFHSFTAGLDRPLDATFQSMMIDTTKFLVEQSNALMGYVQSDEISLLLYSGSLEGDIFFGAKKFKIVSILAAMASVRFNRLCQERLPHKAHMDPLFDARVFQVPTKDEAVNAFKWRWKDALKNSVSMVAQANFSHKQLHKKSTTTKIEMLLEKDVDWHQFDPGFRYGVFVRRNKTLEKFTPDEVASLPPKHDYFKNPDLVIERAVIKQFSSDKPLNVKQLFGEDQC